MFSSKLITEYYQAKFFISCRIVKIWDLRKTYVVNPKYMPQPRYQMQYSESKSTGHGKSMYNVF